jgi:hypothetical protein
MTLEKSSCGFMMTGLQHYLQRGTNGTKEMWSERETNYLSRSETKMKSKYDLISLVDWRVKLRFPGIQRNTGQDQIHIST